MTRKLADPDRSGKNLIVSLPGIHSEHLNSTMTRYFVSRHPGAVTWAKRQGIHVDRIIDHLDIALIHSGDTVIGTLPVNLAAEVCRRGARYLHLSLNLPAELRGRELSAEELERSGACVEEFLITSCQETFV